MKLFKKTILSVCSVAFLSSGCVKVEVSSPFKKKEEGSSNFVNVSPKVNKKVGDDKINFQVISKSEFQANSKLGKIVLNNSPEMIQILKNYLTTTPAKSLAQSIVLPDQKSEETLLLGIPLGLIGEQNIFGGVITQISDKMNENLGNLKLVDVSPIHVRSLLSWKEEVPFLTLIGCASDCDERSKQIPLINLPILGFDNETDKLIIDLSPIGKELDLMKMIDPMGSYTQLRSISSATTTFDYSYSTLVFDIKTKMMPVSKPPFTIKNNEITEVTVRWYLKLNSAFNPAFVARSPVKGVGFFKTERTKDTKITRYSITDYGDSIKYFIKNVPEKWKPAFAAGFDRWNKEFEEILGRKLLSYEFVDADSASAKNLVTGDIRYKIIEWDLNNIASYGGLGPSIANQFTGEIISSNVLVQGPTIISLYTKWFEASSKARKLLAQGDNTQANGVMAAFNRELKEELDKRTATKFKMKLGSLEMNIHSQRDELEDPIIKTHFEIVPENVSFDDYMNGYFQEIVEHELGHNLGLRHNFKGNLGADESGKHGSVSRSIMEYLSRPFRHLADIGEYDRMAIAYGYKGEKPKHLNWFCTDEDQPSDISDMSIKSPECSKSDATKDPYSYWESRIDRAIDLMVERKSTASPVWTYPEIKTYVDEAIIGLSSYAMSAKETSSTWTNFFNKQEVATRPISPDKIKEYVLGSFLGQLCNPELDFIIKIKETPEASELARKNLGDLFAAIKLNVTALGLYSEEEFNCP